MYICLASHLGRFLLREPNRSFKTTLGSTTRLRDIFMHVVLIKKHTWPRGIVRDEEFDVTKKKSQDRLGSLQACLLQAIPTTIVSKFSVQKSHHHEKNVQQKILFYSMFKSCKLMLPTAKLCLKRHLDIHLSSLMRSVYTF